MLTKIPKIMHLYWGGGKLCYLQYMTVETFKKYNPDWRIIIHTPSQYSDKITWETDEQKIKHGGIDFFPELRKVSYVEFNVVDFNNIGFTEDVSEVFKSDYLRWYLLSTVGGGWTDFDVLYTAPLSNIDITDEDTIICTINNIHIIGFYLSKPNNHFFKNLLDNCNNFFDEKQYQSIGSSMLNQLYPDLTSITTKHPELVVKNLHKNVIYPFYHDEIEMIFIQSRLDKITKETVGVHWYNGTRLSKIFNFTFLPNTITNTNTITELLKNKI